ncbi:hypothetical protein AB0I77_06170 [Streptomyces sp. NPDC050619]|uniref:hypothetical protein n=1 Tax=Streptomyces sp. NPDC050619 TaxID=3157214 RepID=UPI003428CAA7
MTAIHTSLAGQVQRLSQVTERPGRLAELLDVAALSLCCGIPEHSVIRLLNDTTLPDASDDDALRALLQALRSIEHTLAVASSHSAGPEQRLRCGRHLPPEQWRVLAEWAEAIASEYPPHDQDI